MKFVFAFVVLGLANCATFTPPCQTAAEVESYRGVILECYKRYTKDTHDLVDVCLTIDSDGIAREHTVTLPHCH